MHISFGKNSRDTVPVGKELSFEQFVRLVGNLPAHHGRLSWAEYVLAGKPERSRDKDSAWFLPAKFIRPERRADAVESLSGFVCDFDDGAITRTEIEAALREYNLVAWSSYSNGVDGLSRWRCFVPYQSPVAPAAHKEIYEHFNKLFAGHLDKRCATISQLWYLRGCPRGAPASQLFGTTDRKNFDALLILGKQSGSGAVAGTTLDLRNGGTGRNGLRGVRPLATNADANDELTTRSPPSLIDIKSALARLDPHLYEDYTEWLTIGMAIYDGTSGTAEGLSIFDHWSKTCPGYAGHASVEAKWHSFGGRAGLSRVTVASLFKQAKDAGWDGADVGGPVSANAPPAAAALPVSAPAGVVQAGHQNLYVPVQPVLSVTAPDRWRSSTASYAIQKKIRDPDTGNDMWTTVVVGIRVLTLELLKTIDLGHHTAEMIAENKNGKVTATFNPGLTQSFTEFKSLLMDRGIIATGEEYKHLQELVVEWLKKIQDAQKVKRSFTHLGWMEVDTKLIGFALGDTAYYPDGSKENGIKISSGTGVPIARHYYPQGDLTKWKSISAFLSQQGRPELMSIIATSFGSPLMKFSGHSGAVVSIVSTASGVGKSTALSLAQSVWASPKAAIHSAADTSMSLSAKMGFTKDLPAYWDDIKGEGTFKQFAETIYHITQGKEKSRLTAGAELREVQNWNCLAVVAANDSIIDIVKRFGKGTDAGAARIFEIRLEKRPEHSQTATFFDQCTSNYGVAGEVYATWLAQNHDKAKEAVEKMSAALSSELDMQSEERFWIAAMSVMLVGATIAKSLGLVNFDLASLGAFLKAQFLRLRSGKTEQMREGDAGPMVADLIMDHQVTTLRIDAMPWKNATKPAITRAPKNGDVDIMIADKDGILRVRRARFVEWCRDKGHSHSTLLTKLQQVGAVTERNADPMVKVSPYSTGSRTTCYDIDLKKLGLEGGDDVDPET